MVKNRRFNDEDEIDLIKKYYYVDNFSSIKIGKILNCSHNTIVRTLKRNNLKLRPKSKHTNLKYSINENYFNVINTNEKAYFLGLLYADGTIRTKDKLVGISLSECDGYIIKEFMKDCNFTGELKTLKSKNIKHANSSYVQIYNESFYLNAMKSGLCENKSLTLKFPSNDILPQNLLSHFIRGYFDGDGCAFIDVKRNKKRLSFVGTFEFLSVIKNFFINNFKINSTKIVRKSNNNTFNYSINKQSDVELIANFLYEKSEGIRLIRKYNKLINKLS